MPPTEQSQYTIYCKDRFDRIDQNVGKIFAAIEGNGNDGIKGRLIKVEAEQKMIRSRWRWIFGIVGVVVAKSAWELWQHFTAGQ